MIWALPFAIGGLVNLFNPESVFIEGGISLTEQFFYDMINNKNKYLLKPNKDILIRPASFYEHATTIGTVSLVLEHILNFNIQKNHSK